MPGMSRSPRGSQYGKQGAGKGASGERANIARRRLPLIEEGGLTFAVNFDDYLDVGIFLDHRVTRNLVRERIEAQLRQVLREKRMREGEGYTTDETLLASQILAFCEGMLSRFVRMLEEEYRKE